MRSAGLAGLLLFLFFFSLTFRVPQWVETFARDFIEREVREELDARIDAIAPPEGSSVVERLAAELYERNQRQVEDLKARLRDRSRDLFVVALDQVRDLGCECRQRIESTWRYLNASKLGELLASTVTTSAMPICPGWAPPSDSCATSSSTADA